MSAARADVVVIGAGLVGLATAWRAARAGMRVVVVSDPERAAASNAAVGGLSFCPADAVLTGNSAIIELSAIARAEFADYIRAVEEASGLPTRHRRQPTLMGEIDDTDAALIDRVEAARAAVGFDSQRLTVAECRALEPGIAETVRAGLRLESHDHIDSRAFTESLHAACSTSGVEFVTGHVSAITTSGGHADGVALSSGQQLEGDSVVLAAGAWSSQIPGVPDELREAVRPVSGQVVTAWVPDHVTLPSHDLRSASAYMVFRSDRSVIVGATKVERGFEETPTVSGVHALLTAGAALWPALLECDWGGTTVGLRPLAADGLPIVGPTSLPGLIAATAHFRNGVMFAAVTAEAVVATMSGAQPREQFAAFSPQRMAAA